MRLDTPRGFRDILPDEALLRERISETVRAVFSEAGYLPVEPPLLESREVLERAGRVKGVPFQLFDTDDHLLMLRPEFTLPIARLVATHAALVERPLRLRYAGTVVREQADGTGEPRQFTQMGAELIGGERGVAEAELMNLLAKALGELGIERWTLAVGSVAPMGAILDAAELEARDACAIRAALHESDLVAVRECARAAKLEDAQVRAICRVSSLRGGVEALGELSERLREAGVEPSEIDSAVGQLTCLYEALGGEARAHLLFDFSLAGSFDYYTGAIFKAYVAGLTGSLAAGGRYDDVSDGLTGGSDGAVGFALSLERIEEALGAAPSGRAQAGRPLRIAVPKGALAEGSHQLLAEAGFDVGELEDPGRKLLIRAGDAEYVIVRAMDAPAFVAHGGAECGICGADSLAEADLDLVTLTDLAFGGCRFVVAAPSGRVEAVRDALEGRASLTVATKYPRITRHYFEAKGVSADVVTLRGNIELGPIIGLSDCIVDITATGATLRENHLEIVADDVLASTARFFASTVAYRTDDRVAALAATLAELVAEEEDGPHGA